MLNDLRHAIRSLAKTPGFTLAVIGTLALGIGATSAVFSVFDAVLLQPLPYRRPERLVRIVSSNPREGADSPTISYPDYMDAVNESAAFTKATVFTEWHPSLSGERSAEILNGAVVDSPYFDVFGVRPERGRFFTRREDRPGQDDMVVISHALWLRQFGGGDIVGKPIRIDGRTLTVAGIVAAAFEDPHMTSSRDLEIWTTIAPTGGNDWARSGRALNSVARLRDGVSIAVADARVKAVAARLRARYPKDNANQDLGVVSLRDSLVGDVRRPMILVLCASALLLLIACVNVMNLVLARTSRRATEIRVRIALGASGRYLVQQFAAEAVVLATLGGAAGVVLATWLVKLFIRIGGDSVPRSLAVTIDHRVLLVALGSTLVVAVVTSLLPALHAFRDRSAGPSATRGTTAGIATQRTQTTLVVAQVAISVVVIATAMLLGRSLWFLMHVSKGIDERGVLAMTIRAPRENYPKRADVSAFYAALRQSVQALPGV
ncbi:MAG: ABC transporter permease, partial [Acidobacteriota bacterium]